MVEDATGEEEDDAKQQDESELDGRKRGEVHVM